MLQHEISINIKKKKNYDCKKNVVTLLNIPTKYYVNIFFLILYFANELYLNKD